MRRITFIVLVWRGTQGNLLKVKLQSGTEMSFVCKFINWLVDYPVILKKFNFSGIFCNWFNISIKFLVCFGAPLRPRMVDWHLRITFHNDLGHPRKSCCFNSFPDSQHLTQKHWTTSNLVGNFTNNFPCVLLTNITDVVERSDSILEASLFRLYNPEGTWIPLLITCIFFLSPWC